MISFKAYINEQNTPVTKQDLNSLERVLDKLYKTCGLDVKFTRHFLDQVNNVRNKVQITIGELQKLFRKAVDRYCEVLPNMKNKEAVLHDMQTDINIPFVLTWNKRENVLDLVTKTVMRKKDFKTRNRKFNV